MLPTPLPALAVPRLVGRTPACGVALRWNTPGVVGDCGSCTLRQDSRREVSPAAHLPCSPACRWGNGGVFWGKHAARTPQRQPLWPTERRAGWWRLLERGPKGQAEAPPGGSSSCGSHGQGSPHARRPPHSGKLLITQTTLSLCSQPSWSWSRPRPRPVSGLPSGSEVGLPHGQSTHSALGTAGQGEARERPRTSRGCAKDGEVAHANLGESQRRPGPDPRGSETVQGGDADAPQSPRTPGGAPDQGSGGIQGPRAPGGDVRSGQPPGRRWGRGVRAATPPSRGPVGTARAGAPSPRGSAQDTWPILPTRMGRWPGGVSHLGDGAGPRATSLLTLRQGNGNPGDTEIQSL